MFNFKNLKFVNLEVYLFLKKKRMSDLHLLQIIGLIVLGHIIWGFARIIFKIYRKNDKNKSK